ELRSHLKDLISSNSLIQNINEQIQPLIDAIENQKEEDESALQVHLDKIAQVQACFPEFHNFYNKACQKLKKRVVNCVAKARECIKKNTFMEFQKELDKIEKILILQEYLHSVIDIKKEIKDLEERALICLKDIANEGFVVLKKAIKEDPSKGQKQKVKKVETANVQIEKLDKSAIDILKKNKNAFDLPCEYVGLDKSTKELVRSFVNEIIEYFEKVRQEISNLFKEKKYEAFDEIKRFVLGDGITSKTGSQYYQTIEKINTFAREVQKDIDTILGSLSTDKICQLITIDCMSWIDERQEDDSSNLIDIIKQKLKLHFYELQQSSQELEIDLDHPEHLKEARRIFNHLGNLRRLEMVIPEITPSRQRVSAQLEQSIQTTLAMIRREFALEAKNVANQEKMKESLIQLKLCAEDIHAANSYLQKMEFKNAKDLDLKINATKTKIEELTKIITMPDQQYKDNTKANPRKTFANRRNQTRI
ncbi:hypothetical protein RFI_29507, partial [Reticulomyxa filosa]